MLEVVLYLAFAVLIYRMVASAFGFSVFDYVGE